MAEHSPSFRVESPADVDRLATDLSATVSNALRESRLDAESTRRQPQLPAYIQAMIEEKRKLRRQWQNLRCPTMKTRLNALAAKISDALETVAVESWHSSIERASDDWSGMHRLYRQLSRKPSPIRPLMASDGTPRYRAEDRANPTADVQYVETIERHVKNYFESPIALTEDPVVFSPGQVQKMNRQTRLRKAPGPDRVTNEALLVFPEDAFMSDCCDNYGMYTTWYSRGDGGMHHQMYHAPPMIKTEAGVNSDLKTKM
ncbi:unnamed protein product [Leptidea sinapis]|uniref:Uncharacterized protein n=1 Tax=Leptidea sinapis TaxID=189913 RepID=A0A5E4QH25_9NEOP|nr:unnamed protein product [Leptidea sinapis]